MSFDLNYRITPVSLGGHRFSVEIEINKPDPAGLKLSLPGWIPGSYLIRDFCQHIGRVTATQNGNDLRVIKKAKNKWHLDGAAGPVTVSYEVFAHDLSVRGSHLDSTHGFFNGSSVFLRIEGQDELPASVEINPPVDAQASDWRVATTLARNGAVEWGFGQYQARDYEDLIDHPVELGNFDLIEFEVSGVPHYFVLSGKHHCNGTRLARDARAICQQHIDLFGQLPEMDRYLFLTRVEGAGYGGLEHRSSCALVCSRHELPDNSDKVNEHYCRFLGLVSHEYFHLWNVKRIKPAEFLPYDLDKESYTELLWVFEGITSYYDDLALVRSDVIDDKIYYGLLGKTVSRVYGTCGHKQQTLAESSFDAWTKFYKPNENTPNSVVSYYAKGSLVALALDLTIRQRTADKFSLDDVMRAMWQKHGLLSAGVPEDGFEEMVEQITGLHMRPFFERYVRGVDELPLESLLLEQGVSLSAQSDGKASTHLGVSFQANSCKIKTVHRDSCAEQAGLAAGDELLAVNGLKFLPQHCERLLGPYNPGDEVELLAFRRDELFRCSMTLEARPENRFKLTPVDEDTSRQRTSRHRWLLGKTDKD